MYGCSRIRGRVRIRVRVEVEVEVIEARKWGISTCMYGCSRTEVCSETCTPIIIIIHCYYYSHNFINLSNIFNMLPYAQGCDLSCTYSNVAY